jgi:hypothetical protein
MRAIPLVAASVLVGCGVLPRVPKPAEPPPALARYEAPGLFVEVRCEGVEADAVVLRVRLVNQTSDRLALAARLRVTGRRVAPDDAKSDGLEVGPWTTQDARLVFLLQEVPDVVRLDWHVVARGNDVAAATTAFARDGDGWRVSASEPAGEPIKVVAKRPVNQEKEGAPVEAAVPDAPVPVSDTPHDPE